MTSAVSIETGAGGIGASAGGSGAGRGSGSGQARIADPGFLAALHNGLPSSVTAGAQNGAGSFQSNWQAQLNALEGGNDEFGSPAAGDRPLTEASSSSLKTASPPQSPNGAASPSRAAWLQDGQLAGVLSGLRAKLPVQVPAKLAGGVRSSAAAASAMGGHDKKTGETTAHSSSSKSDVTAGPSGAIDSAASGLANVCGSPNLNLETQATLAGPIPRPAAISSAIDNSVSRKASSSLQTPTLAVKSFPVKSHAAGSLLEGVDFLAEGAGPENGEASTDALNNREDAQLEEVSSAPVRFSSVAPGQEGAGTHLAAPGEAALRAGANPATQPAGSPGLQSAGSSFEVDNPQVHAPEHLPHAALSTALEASQAEASTLPMADAASPPDQPLGQAEAHSTAAVPAAYTAAQVVVPTLGSGGAASAVNAATLKPAILNPTIPNPAIPNPAATEPSLQEPATSAANPGLIVPGAATPAVSASSGSGIAPAMLARLGQRNSRAGSSAMPRAAALQPGAPISATDLVALARDAVAPHAISSSAAESGEAGFTAGAYQQSTDPFQSLDFEPPPGAPTWTHVAPHQAEAGFQDPSLGWVGVRADMSGGAVHASVVPGSAQAAEELGRHLDGLNTYLAAQHTPVESLGMDAPASKTAIDLGTGHLMQHGGGRQHSHQGTQPDTGAGQGSEQGSHLILAPDSGSGIPQQFRETAAVDGHSSTAGPTGVTSAINPSAPANPGAHISLVA